jgi:hypothetical protein
MSNMSRVLFVAALLLATAPFASAQSARRTDNPNHVAANPAPVTAPVNWAQRGFTVYTNESLFDSDNPGLPNENFEEANPPGCNAFDGPLNSSTNNAWFVPGDILPGLSITTNPTTSPDIFIADVGCFDADSWWVGNNNNTNDFVMNFSPPVDAVGFDFDLDNVGTSTTIEARDSGGAVLGSTTVSGLSPTFRGFAGAAISSVVVRTSLSTEWCEVDNVRFGAGAPACALSFVGTVTATYTSSPRRVTISGRVANSGAPTQAVLEVDYARSGGGPSGTLSFGPQTVPTTTTNGVPFSVFQNVPANAPAGTYNLTFRLIDAGNGNLICATQNSSVVISAPRVGGGDLAWEAGTFTLGASAVTGEAAVAVAPNPFAGRTTISFEVAEATDARLAVYDVLGREVAVLVDGAVEAGTHQATFDASSLAAGTYVYRLVTNGQVETGRLTVAH